MKFKILFAAAIVAIVTACGNRNRNYDEYADEYYEDEMYYDEYNEQAPEEPGYEQQNPGQGSSSREYREVKNAQGRQKKGRSWGGFFGGRTKTHELRDAKTGLVVNSVTYPASWNVISKPVYTIDPKVPSFLIQIEGPNGLKSFNTPLKFHVFYSDPNIRPYLPQSIQKMHRPEIGCQQILQEEVQGRMQKSGFQFVGRKELPEYEALLKQKLQEGGGDQRLERLTTEWRDNKGRQATASITKVAMSAPLIGNTYYTVWFYSVDYTFADEGHLDDSLDEILEAAKGMKENPEWIQYMAALSGQRQREAAERMRQSNIAHRNNMQARQAAFDAHQQRMKGISDAMDANHASFMNRNFGAGSGAGQRDYVNMIHGEETVYNPMNGKSYQVDNGAKQYWMDSNGNLIQNNDLFYTPNGDINLNNRDWVKVREDY